MTPVFLLFSVREINWNYIGDAVPAFLTLIIIPLTFKFVLPTDIPPTETDPLFLRF